MTKFLLTIILVIFLGTMHVYAQQEQQEQQRQAQSQSQKSNFLDKVFFGGGFGAGFGNYTFVNVSPIIGYRITPRLSAGVRLMYQYTTYDYFFGGNKIKFQGHDYGAGVFGRFMVKGPFFLQAEYEYLNYEDIYVDGSSIRSSFDSFMAGGGIAQPISNKAAFFFTVMYNFSYNNIGSSYIYRQPYNSPWVVRLGITAGF